MPTADRMDFESARRHLKQFEFGKLFIDDLGWSRPSSTEPGPVLEVADSEWRWARLAELCGVAVIQIDCAGQELPTDKETRTKLHNEMRTHHHEHLLIFCDFEAGQSLWSWVSGKNKGGLRDHYFFKGQTGDLFLSKLAPLFFSLFDLDDSGNVADGILEVTERLQRALDTQQVTKKFFQEYQLQHNDFHKSIRGIDNELDRQRYASVLLNRMMFAWFLQNKGFLDGGDTNYISSQMQQWNKEKPDRYYKEFFLPLFFHGFGKSPKDRNEQTQKLLGDIPFLGGSLFLPHRLESKYGEAIQIDDEAFLNVANLLNGYTWHLDDSKGGRDNELAPGVLGTIFEKYINQKQFGAYYTREEITRYMCEQTIHKLILDRANSARGTCECVFKSFYEMLTHIDAPLCIVLFNDILPKISILDPACGSGAFLIEAMRVMVDVYSAIIGKARTLDDPDLTATIDNFQSRHPSVQYGIKKKIIAENLFGVDLMMEATEICQLRLYLSLVASVRKKADLEPLPNLDFNILQGNSLIGLLHVENEHRGQAGIESDNYKMTLEEYDKEKTAYSQASEDAETLLKQRQALERKRNTSYSNLNQYLFNKFRNLNITYMQATWNPDKGKMGPKISTALTIDHITDIEPFHWGFDFDAILNKRHGFDIILTNPPWDKFLPNGKEFILREKYSDVVTRNKMTVLDFDNELQKLMEIEEIRTGWLDYWSSFSYQSEWFRRADGYKHQSSKTLNRSTGGEKKTGSHINLYKLFLEQCYNLLHPDGRCGIVIPSGFYSDLGAKGLRELLFNHTCITGMIGFENKKRIFDDVATNLKFIILTFENGATTRTFPASFMKHDVTDLEFFPHANDIIQDVNQIKLHSPNSLSVIELKNELESRIVTKLMGFPKIGDANINWDIKLRTEFNMTSHRHLFNTENVMANGEWLRDGELWINDGDLSLPLYEGKMIFQYDYLHCRDDNLPRYWIKESEARKILLKGQPDNGQILPYQMPRLAYRNIARSTDERTMIMTLLPKNVFCGNSIQNVYICSSNITRESYSNMLWFLGYANSYVFDYLLRLKVSANLNQFFIYEMPCPFPVHSILEDEQMMQVASNAGILVSSLPGFDAIARVMHITRRAGNPNEILTRMKLRCEIDALIAHHCGLSEKEFTYLLESFARIDHRYMIWTINAFRAATASQE